MTALEGASAVNVARRVERRRGRFLLAFLLAGVLLAAGALAFRRSVLAALGGFLVVSDPLERADLIYVFAGDFWGSRVLHGATLGSQGWAPKVAIGGGRYVDHWASDMAVDFAVMHGYPRGLFLPIKMYALTTIDEARVMGPVFRGMGVHRIILVTSNFHSRRAAQVFRQFLPEFEFRMEGAPDNEFDPQAWWTKPRQRMLLISEYQKMAGTVLIRFHLATAGELRQVSNDVP